jgi:hypothetical protein
MAIQQLLSVPNSGLFPASCSVPSLTKANDIVPALHLSVLVEHLGFLGSNAWLTNSEDVVLSNHRRGVQFDCTALWLWLRLKCVFAKHRQTHSHPMMSSFSVFPATTWDSECDHQEG